MKYLLLPWSHDDQNREVTSWNTGQQSLFMGNKYPSVNYNLIYNVQHEITKLCLFKV